MTKSIKGAAAVGYIRVSTDEQAREGVSLEAQEARLRAYCTLTGLELVALVREEGVSGSKPLASRPGGSQLLAAMLEHGASHVVALKLDRLFRDAADALTVTRAWDAEGVAMHLVDMGGQTVNTASAMGRMFLTMMAAFAELERNLISERTRAALDHKRSKGETVSRAPRGLRIAGTRLEADPESDGLALYRRAHELRSAGLTYAAVAEHLTAEGFRPKRRDAGPRMAASVVRYMLQNPRLEGAA